MSSTMPTNSQTNGQTNPTAQRKHDSPPERTLTINMRLLRIVEGILVFGLPPFLLWRGDIGINFAFPLLFIVTALALGYLLLDPSFDKRSLWRIRALAIDWQRILLIYAIAVPVMVAFTVLIDRGVIPIGPDNRNLLFGFPRGNTGVWAIVMLLYPLVSVYPQEILFRTFLFQRYAPAFGAPVATIIFSALAFGWMHVFFGNPIAVPLTIISGALHAWTYSRTRSTACSVFEHALYGNAAFTIGLGWFFYTGAIQT